MTREIAAPFGLDEMAPTSVWVVFQRIEGYYALVWDGDEAGAWIAAGLDEEAGDAILVNDATANGRSTEFYRLDEISIVDALSEARGIPVPIRFPGGRQCPGIAGLALYESHGDRVVLSECVAV